MNNMTVKDFCKKFNACYDGKKWAYKLLPLKSRALMSDIWPLLINNPDYGRWGFTRPNVFTHKEKSLILCKIIRETIWHLLTDERSKKAIEGIELFFDNKIIKNELITLKNAAFEASDSAYDADYASDSDSDSASAYAYASAYAASAAAAAAAAYDSDSDSDSASAYASASDSAAAAASDSASAKKIQFQIILDNLQNPFLGEKN